MPYVGRDLNRGNYLKLDDISSSFDGSETTFNLTTGGQAFYPGSAFSILVVLAGVIQEPESAYTINQSEITFASAPVGGDDFFCIVLGVALGVGVPGNGTVNGTQLASPFSYDGFFYLNDVTNRVGINSSVPTTALDVQGTVTATEFVGNISNPSGISTFYNLTVENDLTVNGSFTTLDTIVTEVDKLEVGANNTTVGVAITQSGTGDILRLYDGASQVVTVTDGGNVGIGSETPQASLDVASTTPVIRFTDTDAGQYTEILHSGTSFYITADRGNSGNGDIIFRSGGTSEKARVTSGGQVGVGTVPNNGIHSSLNRLHVYGPSTVGTHVGHIMLSGDSAVVGEGPQIVFSESGHTSSYAGAYVGFLREGTNSQGSLVFGTRGSVGDSSTIPTERLRITSSGDAGIGTDNPSSKLTIAANSASARLELKRTNSAGGSGSFGAINFTALDDHSVASIHASSDGNDDGAHLIFRTTSTASDNSPYVNDEAVRITSTGNVGIGTDNPSAKLEVASTSLGSKIRVKDSAGYGDLLIYNNEWSFQLNGSEKVRIENNGNVGIGTDSPNALLHLYKDTAGSLPLIQTTSNVVNAGSFTNNYSVEIRHAYSSVNHAMLIHSEESNDARRTLDISDSNGIFATFTNGKVGINSSSPNSKLDINRGSVTGLSDGTVTDIITISETGTQGNTGQRILFKNTEQNWEQGAITALREGVANSFSLTLSSSNGGSNAEALRMTSSGNVGIGLTNPGYKLEVNGSFAATTKSFIIPHPSKENYKLRYACLEGPENSVYVRGTTKDNTIELPDYWVDLIHEESITVNLTPIGNKRIWVEEINNNKVYINSEDTIDCFYTVFAERKDVEQLIVEIEEN